MAVRHQYQGIHQGFTLIEVLVAMVVLTVGILAVAGMQTHSLAGNARAMELTKAVFWAEATMESLLQRPPHHADLEDLAHPGAAGLDCTDLTGTPACLADGGPLVEGRFTIFWNVANHSPVMGCKTIRVLVRRPPRAGPERPNVTLDFIKMEQP